MWRVLKERQVSTQTVIIFAYLFLPLLVTFDSPVKLAASGTEINNERHPYDLRTEVDTSVFISSSFEQEITRPNFDNYAQAILPVHDPQISSDFGWRIAPCKACSSDHKGVDFIPGEGKPVMSVLPGMVVAAGLNEGYGYWVKVEHIVPVKQSNPERWETVYAHLQRGSIPADVYVGAIVERGQTIGAVGSTGISTGPHLHFELLIDGKHVDPLPILAQSQVIKDSEIEWR